MISLRARLNELGIDGHKCEELINEYLQLVRMMPEITMNYFLQQVRDSMK